MGGVGSGRVADPVKQYVELRTPVGVTNEPQPIFLPNYSGVQPAALKGSPSNILQSGAIVFVNSAKQLVGDTSKISILNGGQVGIGIATPVTLLNLKAGTTKAGGLGFGADIAIYTEAGNASLTVDPNNNGHLIRFGAFNSTFMKISADGGLAFSTGASERLIFAPDSVEKMSVLANGNVGIGVVAPADSLSITDGTESLSVGSLGVAGFIGLAAANAAVTTTNYFIASDGGSVNLNAPGAGSSLNFSVANAGKVVILSNGNMGIGTASPGQKLEVIGTVAVSGASGLFKINASPGISAAVTSADLVGKTMTFSGGILIGYA